MANQIALPLCGPDRAIGPAVRPATGAGVPLPAWGRLSRRLAAVPRGDWSPPPLPDLIARIDGALAERRAG